MDWLEYTTGNKRYMTDKEFQEWIHQPRTLKQRLKYWKFRVLIWVWKLKGRPPFD